MIYLHSFYFIDFVMMASPPNGSVKLTPKVSVRSTLNNEKRKEIPGVSTGPEHSKSSQNHAEKSRIVDKNIHDSTEDGQSRSQSTRAKPNELIRSDVESDQLSHSDQDNYNCACCLMSPKMLLITVSTIGLIVGIILAAIGCLVFYYKDLDVEVKLLGPNPPNTSDTAYTLIAIFGYIGHGAIMSAISSFILFVLLAKIRKLPSFCLFRLILVLLSIAIGVSILVFELGSAVYIIVQTFLSKDLSLELLAFPPLVAFNLFWILLQFKTDSYKLFVDDEPEDEKDPENNENVQPRYKINLYFCKCIEETEVSEAYIALFQLIFDWLKDAGIGTFHICSGKYLAGIATYGIVFFAGVIITFTNFSPIESSHNLAIVKDEIWKMSKLWGIIMYIPSFFPICSARLRLFYAKKLRNCQDNDEKAELEAKLVICKDQALWDVCCESFFESIPQSILQTYLLLKNPILSYFGYIPILSVIKSLFGIIGAPITVILERHKTVTITFAEKLTAYATTALRIFSCALFCAGVISLAAKRPQGFEDWRHNLLWSSGSALTIFFLLCAPKIIKYELGKACPKWSLCQMVITDAFTFLVTLSSLYLWLISEVFSEYQLKTTRKIIVIVVFSILMYFSCAGVLLYRKHLELYQSITGTVLLNFYLGIKGYLTCSGIAGPNNKSCRTSVSL